MMGILPGLCVLLLMALLYVAVTEDTVTTVYFTDGGDLTLEVRPAFPGHINDILWKCNGNLLADWVENLVPLSYDPRIKGRANLTIETGQLIINNMSKEDEGVYSVEINDRVQSERYRAKLINKVQMPEVVWRTFTCEAESESCRFTCDSDTTGAEPITYSWKKGEWEVSQKDITIIIKDDSGVKTFPFMMENPVSWEESDPLYWELKPDNSAAIWVGVFVSLRVLAGVVVGLVVAWIKKIGPFKKQGTNITDPAHGNGQPTSPPSDSSPKTAETIPLQDNP
ncbi:carcinoembryonic antigen-related cell adhesion molecule 21-like [Sebastes umbrosus]|uniref:carcinoembryonic antigen-related cell adhesion molecule 21-like n=1 Tax=Sebastes umbrosus TaxID=72105 RepID=UPI00189E51E4|nr:carcinoembryonic antigen-related cell adhesion molecule 21-like [Sebastes umbrosus]